MKHYTTIEQSKKLLELGLSRDTADMVYQYNFLSKSNDTTPRAVNGSLHDTTLRNIPCWSLGALLEVMPKIKEFYYPSLYKDSYSVTACMYSTQDHDIFKIYTGEDFLEAAYSMVIYLLENGYIKDF